MDRFQWIATHQEFGQFVVYMTYIMAFMEGKSKGKWFPVPICLN
jgi:hypothetical protein